MDKAQKRFLFATLVCLAPSQLMAEWRGHGGPVRALAFSSDGQNVISGGFDQSTILWSAAQGKAQTISRLHEGAINALVFLPDGRFISAGEDGRLAIEQGGQGAAQLIGAHQAPIAALAVSPDGKQVASGSFDRGMRLTTLADQSQRVFEGHQGPVTSVAFLPDQSALVSIAFDATLRIWPLDKGPPKTITLPANAVALAVTAQGDIITGGSDGMMRVYTRDGAPKSEVQIFDVPITAMALSKTNSSLALASALGALVLFDLVKQRETWRKPGPSLPVWAMAFSPDATRLLTGGADKAIHMLDAKTGAEMGAPGQAPDDEIPLALQNDLGAKIFAACSACHTLTKDGGNRAGPSLHGIFGRKIASLKGYNFSSSLQKMQIIWTPETVSQLFEQGPAQYTPGTKMPEQTISDAQDRAALIAFLQKATAPQ